jgi:hypothetical protein
MLPTIATFSIVVCLAPAGLPMAGVSYKLLPASEVPDEAVQRSADLFSNHYGTWAPNPCGCKPGARVRMSAHKLQAQMLFDDQCKLITAEFDGALIGQAFVRHFDVPGKVCYRTIVYMLGILGILHWHSRVQPVV